MPGLGEAPGEIELGAASSSGSDRTEVVPAAGGDSRIGDGVATEVCAVSPVFPGDDDLRFGAN